MDLEAALTRLPPGYRTVILLHDVEGFTHEEIGEKLGISANTSKSQLSRGRRLLRSLLAPEDGHEARV
jgi:RNA polymerase sigma-70 factor (ECF subfamily)